MTLFLFLKPANGDQTISTSESCVLLPLSTADICTVTHQELFNTIESWQRSALSWVHSSSLHLLNSISTFYDYASDRYVKKSIFVTGQSQQDLLIYCIVSHAHCRQSPPPPTVTHFDTTNIFRLEQNCGYHQFYISHFLNENLHTQNSRYSNTVYYLQ